MTIRVLYNYVLVRLGLRRILPAEIVNRKEVRECGEEMVKTHSDDITYANSEDNYARLGVMTRLVAAAELVQKMHGLKLFIYELYRSPENQAELRERDRQELMSAYQGNTGRIATHGAGIFSIVLLKICFPGAHQGRGYLRNIHRLLLYESFEAFYGASVCLLRLSLLAADDFFCEGEEIQGKRLFLLIFLLDEGHDLVETHRLEGIGIQL